MLYLKNDFMNCAAFLHADTKPRELKVILVIIGSPWSNIGVAFYFIRF